MSQMTGHQEAMVFILVIILPYLVESNKSNVIKYIYKCTIRDTRQIRHDEICKRFHKCTRL